MKYSRKDLMISTATEGGDPLAELKKGLLMSSYRNDTNALPE